MIGKEQLKSLLVYQWLEEIRKKDEARLAAEDKAAAARAKADNKPVTATVRRPTRTTNDILNSTPEAAKLSSDFLGNRGRLPWPVLREAGRERGCGPQLDCRTRDDTGHLARP